MRLIFTKMHGLGNDFIVVNALEKPFALTRDEIRALAHRRFGIGFDQVLIVEPASVDGAEFDYRIFNADGGEVENCGNGARCFARYVHDQGLTQNRQITVQSGAGLMRLSIEDDGQVTVQMETPQFQPALVPFVADTERSSYLIDVGGIEIEAGVVAVGNPHVVLVVDDVEHCQFEQLGPQLERHERFPNRVNVGFMQRIDRDEIKLRVFERGVGETMACGTGACAAVVTGINRGLLDKEVTVHLAGGDLRVGWPDNNKPVAMTGPCETVYEGTLE
jgi:diaminopimelate epimerase